MNQENYVQILVEDTNAEAMVAKISAIKKGYFKDPFAEELVKGQTKKDVIIHRGYWCRHNIFNRLVSEYIEQNDICQIISLGCGYDTMPFLMMEQFPKKEFKFVETDLEIVVKRKIKKIQESAMIKQLLSLNHTDVNQTTIDSEKYQLFGQDLSHVNQFMEKLKGLDTNKPTLVFAECVLTYIDPASTAQLLKELCSTFTQLTFLNYEMFNPNDCFGKMMVKNFDFRGCPLIGIDAYPTMKAQIDRLHQSGYQDIQIEDMRTLYRKGTKAEERKRIEQIEMLDEWEEWDIMQSHYFVSLAYNYKTISLKLVCS